MYPEFETRRGGASRAVFAIVVLALMCYLTFAALQGEYGLFRLIQVEAEESRLRLEIAELEVERADLENKTRGLSTRSLDLDLLDQQARKVLGLGRHDEIMIR